MFIEEKEVDFLLINPWIYDFSAHDFWLKPYGLLKLAGLLRKEGYQIYYLDLLDPFHPDLPKAPKRKTFGTGHFYKEVVPKPAFLKHIPRKFYRYGLPFDLFLKEVSLLKFKAVMLTCTMTYWYPGLFVLIDFFAKHFPEIPLYIGGIYSKLCEAHLRNFLQSHFPWAKVEIIFKDLKTFVEDLKRRWKPTGIPYSNAYPAFDLLRKIPYVVLLTSEGCPFSCPYCASKKLYPVFRQRPYQEIIEEIKYWHKEYGVTDFAFYDDALLVNFERHLAPLLESVLSENLKVRFHTPNALHARFITKEVAQLLKRAGFVTLRLGLERVEDRVDNKVTIEEFIEAIKNLKEASFTGREVGAYILYGLPEENWEAVKKSLSFLERLEVSPFLAEFSPIPGTPFFELTKALSPYPLEDEPLSHNNTIFPALKNPPWDVIQEIKNLARKIRIKLKG
ncbi:MAG: B12-binding domain-containing radical SAM protein [Caldimicrobium sp.]